MGVALTSCTVPAAGKPTFDLGEKEMEMGVGIHGEPGRRRVPLARREFHRRRDEVGGDRQTISAATARGDRAAARQWLRRDTLLMELYLMYNAARETCSRSEARASFAR